MTSSPVPGVASPAGDASSKNLTSAIAGTSARKIPATGSMLSVVGKSKRESLWTPYIDTPIGRISNSEYERTLLDREKREELLLSLKPDVLPTEFIHNLRHRAPGQGSAEIKQGCLIALNKLLDEVDVDRTTNLVSFLRGRIKGRVQDTLGIRGRGKKLVLEQLESEPVRKCSPGKFKISPELSASLRVHLSPVEYDVLILRISYGFTCREIGPMIDRSEPGVYSIWTRALSKLRVIVRKKIPQSIWGEDFPQEHPKIHDIESRAAAVLYSTASPRYASGLSKVPFSSGYYDLARALEGNSIRIPSTEVLARFADNPGFFSRLLHQSNDHVRRFLARRTGMEGALRFDRLDTVALNALKVYVGSNLDDIPITKALASLLGAENVKYEVLREGVRRGIISPEIPEGHNICKKGGSYYFKAEVVGKEWVERNLVSYLSRFETLDDIGLNKALATVLGARPTVNEIARAVLKLKKKYPDSKVPDANLPDGHSINRTVYLRKEVVGGKQVIENITRHVRFHGITLDTVPRDEALASALGVPRKTSAIVKALVDTGVLSSQVPDNYAFNASDTRGSGATFFIRAEIVGKKQAFLNFQKIIQDKYSNLDSLEQNLVIANFLGVRNTKKEIVKALVKQGIFKPEPPAGHIPGKYSLYFQPDIVGSEAAIRCGKKHRVSH